MKKFLTIALLASAFIYFTPAVDAGPTVVAKHKHHKHSRHHRRHVHHHHHRTVVSVDNINV